MDVWVLAPSEDAEDTALDLQAVVFVLFVDELDEAEAHNVAMEQNFEPDSDDEQQEGVMVLDAHAVVDPGAMVVESLNALVADGAVSRPG